MQDSAPENSDILLNQTTKGLERTFTENLLRDSTDAIYFKDLESRFIRISRYLATRLGIDDPNYLIGKTDFDIFDINHAQAARNDELDIIATGQPKEAILEREVRLDGEVRWVLTTKMPLRNDDDKIIGTFGISRDITAQKEAELALEESNRKLIDASRRAGMAEIAINILHNIGNVLNSLNVSSSTSIKLAESQKHERLTKVADLLEENASEPHFLSKNPKGQKIAPYLRKLGDQMGESQSLILEELKALSNHVDHIKHILKTQQNYAEPTELLQHFELSEVIQDAIQINRDGLRRHQVELETDFECNPVIESDKHRVLQILVNVIRNGKYACDEGNQAMKQITIQSRLTENNVAEIAIMDNGIGIPEENLDSIFKHGFTTRDEGNGYGLHSSANLATEIGGKLTAASDGQYKGATFTLTIPLKRPESTQDDVAL